MVGQIVGREAPISTSFNAIACLRFGRLRTAIGKALHEKRRAVVNESAGLLRVDIGQVLVLDRARLAARPAIGLARIRVDSVGDELLPLGEQFKLLLRAVGGGQIGDDFGERRERPKREATFGRAPNAGST